MILFLVFAVFPVYFVIEAAFRPGQSLYSTTLQLFPTNPSLENFSRILCLALDTSLRAAALTSLKVLLWENATAWASYRIER